MRFCVKSLCFIRTSNYLFLTIALITGYSVLSLSVFKASAQVLHNHSTENSISLESLCDPCCQGICFDQEISDKFKALDEYSSVEEYYDNQPNHSAKFASSVSALGITASPLALRLIALYPSLRQFFSPLKVVVGVASVFFAKTLITAINQKKAVVGVGSQSLIITENSKNFALQKKIKNHNFSSENNPHPDDHQNLLMVPSSDDHHATIDNNIEKSQVLYKAFIEKLAQLEKLYFQLDHQTFSAIIKDYVNSSIHSSIDEDFRFKHLLLDEIYHYFSYSSRERKKTYISLNDNGSEAKYIFLVHIMKLIEDPNMKQTIFELNIRTSKHAINLLEMLKLFLGNYHDKDKLHNFFVKAPFSDVQLEQEVKLLETQYLVMPIDELIKILGQFIPESSISKTTPKKLVHDLIDYFSVHFYHPKYIKQLKYKYIFYALIVGLKDEPSYISSKKLNYHDDHMIYRVKRKLINYLNSYLSNEKSQYKTKQLSKSKNEVIRYAIDQELEKLIKMFFQLSEQDWKKRLSGYVNSSLIDSISRKQLLQDLQMHLELTSQKKQPDNHDLFIKRSKIIFLSLIMKFSDRTYDDLSKLFGLASGSTVFKMKERIENFLRYYPVNDFQDLSATSIHHANAFNYTEFLAEIDGLKQDFYAMDDDKLVFILSKFINKAVLRVLNRAKLIDDIYQNFEKIHARSDGLSSVTNGMKLLYVFLAIYGRSDSYKQLVVSQNMGFNHLSSISKAKVQLMDFLKQYSLKKHTNPITPDYSKNRYIPGIADLSIFQLKSIQSQLKTTINKIGSDRFSEKGLNDWLVKLGLSTETTITYNIDGILDSLEQYLYHAKMEKMPESSELRSLQGKILLSKIIGTPLPSVVKIFNGNKINSKSDIFLLSEQVDFFIANIYPQIINDQHNDKQTFIHLDKIKHSILVDNDSIDSKLIYEMCRKLSIDRFYVPMVVEKLQKLSNYYKSIDQSHKIDYIFHYIFQSSQDDFDLYQLDDKSPQPSDQLLAIIDLYSVLDSVPRSFLNWMELKDYQDFTLKRHLIQYHLIEDTNIADFAFDLSTRIDQFIANNPDLSQYSSKQHSKIKVLLLARLGIPNIYQSNLYRILHLPIDVIKKVEEKLYQSWISRNLHHNIYTRSKEDLVKLLNNLTNKQASQFSAFFPNVEISNLRVKDKQKLSISFLKYLENNNDIDKQEIFLSQVIKLDYPLMIPSGIAPIFHDNSHHQSDVYLDVLNQFKQFVRSKKSCIVEKSQCSSSSLVDSILLDAFQQDQKNLEDQALQQLPWINQLKQAYIIRSQAEWADLAIQLGYPDFSDYFQSKLNSFSSYLYNKDKLLWSIFVVEVLKIKDVVDLQHIKSKIQLLDPSKKDQISNVKTIVLTTAKEFINYMDISEYEFNTNTDLKNNIEISLLSLSDNKLADVLQFVEQDGSDVKSINHIIYCASRIFYNRRLLYIFDSKLLNIVSDQDNLGASIFNLNTYFPQDMLFNILKNAFFNCLNHADYDLVGDYNLHRLSNSYRHHIQDQKRYFFEDIAVYWQHLTLSKLRELLVNIKLRIVHGGYYQDRFVNPIVPAIAAQITKVDIENFLNSLSDDEKLIFLVMVIDFEDISVIDLAKLLNFSALDLAKRRDKIKSHFLKYIKSINR